LIADRFLGRGEHDVELRFHLGSDLAPFPVELSPEGRDARLRVRSGGAGLTLSFHAPAPLAVRVLHGDGDAPEGWISRRYGERRPGAVAAVRLRAEAPTTILTLLAPFAADALPALSAQAVAALPGEATGGRTTATRRDGGAVAIAIRGGAAEDFVLAGAEDGEVRRGPIAGRGELFWLRRRGPESWERLLAVAGRCFDWNGVPLWRSAEPATRMVAGPERAASVAGGGADEETNDVRHRGRS
jgi:hypothetical protein